MGLLQRRWTRPQVGPGSSGWTYRVGLLLVALAIVPLLGAGWFAAVELVSVRHAEAKAASVDESVTELVALTELRTRLLDERNWHSALGGIDQLGLDVAFVKLLSGLDIPSEVEESRERVDQLVALLELDELAARLEIIRADEIETLEAAGARYNALEVEVAALSEAEFDSLLLSAGSLEEGDALVVALRVLENTTVARQAVSEQFTAFFSAQFSSDGDRLDEVSALIALQVRRATAEAQIQRIAPPGSETVQTYEAVVGSESVQIFEGAVDRLVSDGLSGGRNQGDTSLEDILQNVDQIAVEFAASSDSTELYFDLVNAAGADALNASRELGDRADAQARDAVVSILGLVALSLFFAAAAARAIGRPMRNLAQTAQRISDGDATARAEASAGPVEIRHAARAMNEAALHLQLAEQQASALAEGDLDHPVLERATTGQLGASLQNAVRTLADSMHEREDFRRRMTHEATHDGLTQISNRNASLAQLDRALARAGRSSAALAVLYIDLDGFKSINDLHGHQAGDAVLRETAQRLVNGVRQGDHVGRLGGDEFVVIAEAVAGIEEAVHVAQRLLERLGQTIQVDGASLSTSVSIGIALFDDVTTTITAVDLLRDADLALYKAKADGRSRIVICNDQLRAAMAERADLETALRQAIVDHELVLFYQPIIKPVDESVQGFEALIRWKRPGHGFVAPDDFIPFAERSELIILIDQWVIGAVVRQIKAWDADGLFTDLPISVNISGRHLSSPSFVEDVLTPLRDRGISPNRIVVEITESALLDDLGGAATKLQALRDQGIRTAIDDFGTGYTSLAHLKSLPIDILKIDRSFTNDESAASLVKLIIDTGHLLGASITAEGIETSQQAAQLANMGSDDLQGYLFGRPQAAAELVGEGVRRDTEAGTSSQP